MKSSIAEKFANKYEPVPWTGCWLWTGTVDVYGYGGISAYVPWQEKRTLLKAHRVSYELHVGPIPKGLCVLHSCDVRCCVNPAHLSLGTNADNNRDAIKRGRAPQLIKRFTAEELRANKLAHYHRTKNSEVLARKRAYYHRTKGAA